MISQTVVSSDPKDIAEELLNYREGHLVGVQRVTEWESYSEQVEVRWTPDRYCEGFKCVSLFITDRNGDPIPSLEGATVRLYEMPGFMMDTEEYLAVVRSKAPVAEGNINKGKAELSPSTISDMYVQILVPAIPISDSNLEMLAQR